ncbi:MAG: metalloregulator ArsR/SmtB family transcription factor [Candidatus Micrarchaeota archaeon]|nr:metalloregulator ArsR/SmtB family transcription factor [Candidatus Micrarchaeota archaeon]
MKIRVLKALADDTRMRFLERIARKEICACKLPRIVGKTQPAVSQHLSVLLGAGLVRMRKDGKKRIYSVSERGRRALRDISKW